MTVVDLELNISKIMLVEFYFPSRYSSFTKRELAELYQWQICHQRVYVTVI